MTDGYQDVPDSFCLLPWVNLSIDVDGTSRPCCKYEREQPDSSYSFANLRNTPLRDVWNSDAMQQLRSDFLAGEKPAGCSACWDEESAGIRSFRQTYLDDRRISSRPDPNDLTPTTPVALDLKLSNACNLKCRICGPVASSLWLNEELKHASEGSATQTYLDQNKRYFLSNKITKDLHSSDELRRWAPHIESLEMTGGEPMLAPENREIIEAITEHGRPEQVTLTLTTNGAVIDERVMAALPRFGEVVISLSIDDIGRRLEYQRMPAKWAEVDENLDRYKALASPTCQVFTNATISTLNVWYLPEYLAWIHERFPNGEIQPNLNLVHNPRHYCIQVLPAPLKDVVYRRLKDAQTGPWAEHIQAKGHDIAGFLMSADEDDDDQWWKSIRTTTDRDQIRGEKFETAHPEWHAVIDRLGYWDRPGRPVSLSRRLWPKIKR